MASISSLGSEEQFQCSICLDVFTDPVTIQCGHNFCMACITTYWDSTDLLCQCPMCKMTFDKRPDLFVNTFISEMAAPFRKPVPEKAASQSDQCPTLPAVSCDICTGTKLRALKSCLVCQASYCETHLEPHQRVTGLKKHKLINPVENLEDRMCQKHERPLELFCRTDQTCVCHFCTEGEHKNHDTALLEEEYGERKANLGKTKEEIQQLVKERLTKVQDIKLSIDVTKRNTEREISKSVEVFTAVVHSIERSMAEFIKVLEEKQKAAEKKAEGFIKKLEQEITELQRRNTELEQLSHTQDHLVFLQSSTSMSALPHTKDWSRISIHSSVGREGRALSQLEDTVLSEIKRLRHAELKRIQQYAVDVTLDPNTALPSLILYKDGKQVKDGLLHSYVLYSPGRFSLAPCVLGKRGFSSGRFYYEVQVKGKTDWDLGVARQSLSSEKGGSHWVSKMDSRLYG